MKVLVSDNSILNGFSRRDLLDKMFRLDLQFAVADLRFHEELIDLGSYSREDLVSYGLGEEATRDSAGRPTQRTKGFSSNGAFSRRVISGPISS